MSDGLEPRAEKEGCKILHAYPHQKFLEAIGERCQHTGVRRFTDDTVLTASAAFERAGPWHDMYPPHEVDRRV